MRSAVDSLLAARPALTSIRTGAAALGLEPLELLHAGPPLPDPARPPPPLASSAIVTCLHEGWAGSEAEAERLLAAGGLRWRPAQSRGCVVPLASVVSAGTPLVVVEDAAGTTAAMHAPLSAVRGVDTRMGGRDPGLLSRLRQRDRELAPALAAVLDRDGPVALWLAAGAGLAAGDDLHSRTAGANEALVGWLRGQGAAGLADDVAATPLFFLTIWMAACALVLRAAEGADCPTLVTRAGGNGARFAIALAGRPEAWIDVVAEAPAGALLPSVPAGTAICGAVGDSAVIDMLGFGGQRLALAPEPLGVLGPWVPAEHHPPAVPPMLAPHPLLPGSWPIGLDAARLAAQGASPLVALAMLAADGRGGFAGRGIYRPPPALFAAAAGSLA